MIYTTTMNANTPFSLIHFIFVCKYNDISSTHLKLSYWNPHTSGIHKMPQIRSVVKSFETHTGQTHIHKHLVYIRFTMILFVDLTSFQFLSISVCVLLPEEKWAYKITSSNNDFFFVTFQWKFWIVENTFLPIQIMRFFSYVVFALVKTV